MKPKLRIVTDSPTERIFGSARFIRMVRNPALQADWPFEPTRKGENDVVI